MNYCPTCNGECKKASYLYDLYTESGNSESKLRGSFGGAGLGVGTGGLGAGGFGGKFGGDLTGNSSNTNIIAIKCRKPKILEPPHLLEDTEEIIDVIPAHRPSFEFPSNWLILIYPLYFMALFCSVITYYNTPEIPATPVYRKRAIENPKYLPEVMTFKRYDYLHMCTSCGAFWYFNLPEDLKLT